MSIVTLKRKLSGTPGAEQVTMKYEDGGKVAVYTIGSAEFRLDAAMSEDAVVKVIIEGAPSE